MTCREDKKRKHQTELLDDEEIESVINNTESFLDNVEEVLDSLDSDLDDSDEGATCSFQFSAVIIWFLFTEWLSCVHAVNTEISLHVLTIWLGFSF